MEWQINNSNNEQICIKLDIPDNASENKLAFVCHGITGYKEQEVILQIVAALKAQGYKVVTFDCRNSRGESFNNSKCANLTDIVDDLKTVIGWAKKQAFYTSSFVLAGHSLGGSAVLEYAVNDFSLVKALILVSSVFSGRDLLENTQKFAPEFLQCLKNDGVIRSRNGVDCYLDFSYLQDMQKYDFYKNIKIFQNPVLLITGDKDSSSLPKNNLEFYQQIKSYKEIHILKDCSHIYEKPQNQEDLYKTITAFIDNIKNESNY